MQLEETSKSSNIVNVPLSYVDPHLINSFDPLAETSLNLEDVLLSYPSPPADPELPLPTLPTSGNTSTVSDTLDDENDVIAVSTSFNPASYSTSPDIIFNTSDRVLFYAHSQVLSSVSPKAFGKVIWGHNENLTSPEAIIHHIPDSSAVFNVILHTLYGTSPAQNSPSFETLLVAVDHMPIYAINPKHFITPQTPLYHLLLTQAPLYPLHLYSLAARHGLEDLAISSSSHLLSFPLMDLPDEMAIRMGAIYLKRLFCLHLRRINALRDLLLVSPHPHPPTKKCDFIQQKALTRAWALVSAYLAWEARADLSTASLRNAFGPLTENLSCKLCRSGLEKRTKEVIYQWAAVKPTI